MPNQKVDDQPESLDQDQKEELKEVEPMMGPASAEPDEVIDGPEAVSPDDVSTDEAVEAIAKSESSALIKAEDEKQQAAVETLEAPKKRRFVNPLRFIWRHKKLRKVLMAGLLIGIVATAAVPSSRYFLLNTAGVKVSASFKVLNEATDQPLKNVDVRVGDVSGKTDDQGVAKLDGLRLGKAKLVINKRSFAPIEKDVTIGWGSNPFTPFELAATGAQYKFVLTDWLSGAPIERAEVREGDSSAFSDKDGMAVLTFDPGEANQLDVTVTASDYRTESLKIPASQKDIWQQKLVAGSPHFFMSRRSGQYDLYKIDADSQNEDLILAGTGKERDDIVLAPSPNKKFLAYVSTRKGTTDQNGYAKQSLAIVDVATKELSEISESEQIRFVGWLDTGAVFVKVVAGDSGDNPNRQKLLVYDVVSKNLQDIAANDTFNEVTLADGRIYYAPSNIYGGTPEASFVSVKPDGSDKQTLLNRETWSVLRTSYDTFSVSTVGNKWYSYRFGDKSAADLTTPTATPRDRQYSDNQNRSHSVWFDYRDGKGVVLDWDVEAKTEKILLTKGGLTTPLQWLSGKHLIYRLVTLEETADYVVNIGGGEPQKIVDVAASSISGGVGYY